MDNSTIFDPESMSLDLTEVLKSIPFSCITKGLVERGKENRLENFIPKDYDIKITLTTHNTIRCSANVSLGNPIFLQYSYISFYAMRDALFFKLSNRYNDRETYSITRNTKKSGIDFLCTKVAGDGYYSLSRFEGVYKMTEYGRIGNEDERVFFIVKPYMLFPH